jgi:hypothetical protein
MAGKHELLHFLDRKVFDPILSASPDRFSGPDQDRLTDVQNRTRSEKERFHNYGSAQEVVENYKRDLTSHTARRVNSELEKLKLPTLPSVRDEFMQMAGK